MLIMFTDTIQWLDIDIWKITNEILFWCKLRTVYIDSMGFTIITNNTKLI
jgi:hypothetical protein